MSRVLGNISCDFDPPFPNNVFLVMYFLNHWPEQLQALQVHSSYDVEDNASCDLDLGQIKYFL